MRMFDMDFDDFDEFRNIVMSNEDNPKLVVIEMKKLIWDTEREMIENHVCPNCGGELEPRLVMKERGTGPYDPNYWPAEYEGQCCTECEEEYD